MPPNAPSGATHMISRMIPKTTREAHLEDADDRLALTVGEHRDRRGDEDREHEDRQDLVLDERGDEARRQQVVGDEADEAGRGVAGLGDRLLGRLLRGGARLAVEARAGREHVGRDQAERRARSRSSRRSRRARAARARPRARGCPSEAMPITTVRKITGPVTALISWMKASASHLASSAGPFATRPKMIPADDRDDDPEPQLFEDSPLSHVGAFYPPAELSARAADLHGG